MMRAQRDVDVGRLGERDEVLQRELAHHLAGEVVEPEEGVGQQREQRAEVDHAEPQQRRREQRQQQQAAARVQQVGGAAPQPAGGSGANGGGGGAGVHA